MRNEIQLLGANSIAWDMIVAWLRKVPVTCNWFDLSCISMARDNPKQWVADSTESTILLTMRAEGVCTVFIVVPTGTLKDAKGYNICHLTDLSILIGRKSSPCNMCQSTASGKHHFSWFHFISLYLLDSRVSSISKTEVCLLIMSWIQSRSAKYTWFFS